MAKSTKVVRSLFGLARRTLCRKLLVSLLLCAAPAHADEISKALATWEMLQDSDNTASFETYANFILNHPDWPKLNVLREAAEQNAANTDNTAQVLAYFAKNPPRTIAGLDAYVDALTASGKTGDARTALRTTWEKGLATPSQQTAFLDRYRNQISEDEINSRASNLIWTEQIETAQSLTPTLDSAHRALMIARLALHNEAGNADALVNAVPAALQNDPGLIYERVRWRNRNDNEDGAIALLRQHPNLADGDATDWWKQRDSLAHWALEQGDSRAAYEIARDHGFSIAEDSVPYMEAEGLAGWIALRFLNNPQQAAVHFARLNSVAVSVISKSRAAYWLGRAEAAQGHTDKANHWYEVAAAYGTTFYGQVAAIDRYNAVKISAPGESSVSTLARQNFNARELVRVTRLVATRGDATTTKLFLRALGDSVTSPEEATLTAKLATELHRREMAAWIAKTSGRKGYVIGREGYPVLSNTPSVPDAAILHAIIRQESGFDEDIKSPAGAIGLMQIMPATAQHLAKKLGIKTSASQLTNGQHNMRLGSYFLEDLLEDFSGSLPLAAAAYNAGPSRANDWIERFGDPRSSSPAILTKLKGYTKGEPRHWLALDVVESYPFSETRFYIQQVLANQEVYRAVLKGGSTPLLIRQALAGG